MPRPDPFDFLSRNGIHVRPPRTPPETETTRLATSTSASEVADQDMTPKAKPRARMASAFGGDGCEKVLTSNMSLGIGGKAVGNGESGEVTQIVMFEPTAHANQDEVRTSRARMVGGKLGESQRVTQCYSGIQVKARSKECWVIGWGNGVREAHIPSTDSIEKLLAETQSSHSASLGMEKAKAPSLRVVSTRLRPVLASTQESSFPLDLRPQLQTASSTFLPFKAPITEITLATLKIYSSSSESNARFEETIGHLVAAFARSSAGSGGQDVGDQEMKGMVGAAWGKVREREDQYVFVFGWESLGAHAAAVRSAYGSSTIMLLEQLTDLEFLYVELKEVDVKTQT